jgi:prolyl oligopeptidase
MLHLYEDRLTDPSLVVTSQIDHPSPPRPLAPSTPVSQHHSSEPANLRYHHLSQFSDLSEYAQSAPASQPSALETAVHRLLTCLAIVGLSLLNPASSAASKYAYPQTRSEDRVDMLHGVGVADPYRWLEDGDSDEVAQWTNAQNELTRSLLDQFSKQRRKLRRQLEQLYRVTSETAPARYGDLLFFSRRNPDDGHAIIYARPVSTQGNERVVINPNTFSESGNVALDWHYPSPDGELIAYGKSADGSELSTLHLMDVESATELALKIPHTRACELAWVNSRAGFYYTRYPTPGEVPAGDENYFRHVYYHRFGTDWKDDTKIFGEQTPKERWNSVGLTNDNQHIVITSHDGHINTDVWIAHAHAPSESAAPIEHPISFDAFTPVAVGLNAQSGIDTYQGKLFVRTNLDAPRYRIMVADVARPGSENWKELIPEQEGVIRGMRLAGGKLVLSLLENAQSKLRVYSLDGELDHEIELPTLGSISQMTGRPDDRYLYYSFESFAYPRTVFRYNLNTQQSRIISRIRTRADLDDFKTEQKWFKSKDGTRVPMFVVTHKDYPADGRRPTLLYGYGGFNNSMTPFFWRSVFPWLEDGGVFALANIRGGGEFGREWHEGAILEKRQNAFDDFIAAGQALMDMGYTSSDHLAIRGGSNGGLLVGAVMTQRPDLCKAVVCQVPLLDMIRYHQREIARLWIPEFGDPDKPEDFAWLIKYSPYHNIHPNTEYPATLIRTALSDSRVDPMHARKMAALLQRDNVSDNPILLWVEAKAGHGSGKTIDRYLDDQVDVMTFLYWQLGMWE